MSVLLQPKSFRAARRLKLTLDPALAFDSGKIERARENTPNDRYRRFPLKPIGLWYGFETSWLERAAEMWSNWERMKLVELELRESRILTIDAEDKLDAFTKLFTCPQFGPFGGSGYRAAYWPAVYSAWGGVEVPIYTDELVDDRQYSWLDGWDAASGCVWSRDAITAIKPISARPSELINWEGDRVVYFESKHRTKLQQV